MCRKHYLKRVDFSEKCYIIVLKYNSKELIAIFYMKENEK